MGGKSGGNQVTGYRYYFGLHGGLGRGPVDEIVRIKVGDQIAWSGSMTDNATIDINKPNLFGGDKKEGGLVGSFTLLMGAPTQSVFAPLAAMLGRLVPAFRGVATWFYDGQVCANNPYPKPWLFRVRRSKKGWYNDSPWYPGKATIYMQDQEDPSDVIYGMNPAHILYECITNPEWGRGLPAELIDEVSFRSAANTLSSEGFGLCLRWNRQDGLGEFVSTVCSHIAAALYVDRSTGLFTLRLLRGDYDAETLGSFDYNSGLLAIEDDENGAADSMTNEVIVKYHQQVRDEDRQVRVQNIASHQATGSVVSTTIDYPGISTAELATRVAQRELKIRSAALKRFRLTVDRRGWKIAPGSVFKISAPDRGIGSMVVRAGKIEESDPTGNKVTVWVVQDIFGLPATSFVRPQPSLWTPPDGSAKGITSWTAYEATYRDLVRQLTPADLATVADDAAALVVIAGRPSPLSTVYDIYSKAAGETDFADRGDGDFSPFGLLVDGVGFYDTSVLLTGAQDIDEITDFPTVGLLGDEFVRVESINASTGEVTIARGCVDTVPQAHAAGTVLFIYDQFSATDDREYSTSDEVTVRVLTRTLSQGLDLDLAPEKTVTMGARHFRPYPPGALQVNGTAYGLLDTVVGVDAVLTWEHRDRLAAMDVLVAHGEAGGSAEVGTTYNVRVYDGVTLLRSATGITGETWTYTQADWITDGSVTTITIELEAERGSVVSWTKYQFTFDMS